MIIKSKEKNKYHMLIVGRTDAKAESLTLRELILRRVDKESRALEEEKGTNIFFFCSPSS